MTLGFAPHNLEGVASGTSNALRQLGTVLGIPAMRNRQQAAHEAATSDGAAETVPVSALG